MILHEKHSNSQLLFAINQKKIEMIALGEKYGLQDQQTIQCSQELDSLLNEHFLNSTIQKNERVS